jgi:hypothetical protein
VGTSGSLARATCRASVSLPRNFSTSPARRAVFIGPGIGCGNPRSARRRWIAREAVFAGEHRALGAHDGQRHVYG